LKDLRKTTKDLNQYNLSSDRDLNPGLSKYEATHSTAEPGVEKEGT
jgi:hypothetical protein